VEAERFYRAAVQLEPTNASPAYALARFLQNIRANLDEAEVYYRKAAALDVKFTPEYADFLKDGRTNYAAAERVYRQAIERAPTDGYNIFRLAELLKFRNQLR
jgi:tetratricopeptide (TPR) repeat protein